MKVLMEQISSVEEKELQCKPDYITDERWEKILRIHLLEDKKRSLLAGKLLHQMCTECEIKEPVYGTIGSGKPVLLGKSNLVFNISHSGEYVVLVYETDAAAIGVDIQQTKKMSDGLKKRLLHEKEYLKLEKELAGQKIGLTRQRLSENGVVGSEKEPQAEMLHLNRIWAIKESYVKMTGEGLSHDFRKLCIDFDENVVIDEEERVASFIELDAPEGYVMAVTLVE